MSLLSAYKENSITSQNKERLVVMLYDGAIKFLNMAKKAIEEKNFAEKNTYLAKAQDIIDELNTVLDMESGGEIAKNLRNLYLFMNRHLSQANMQCDIQKIDEVIKLLEEINQSWKKIAQ